MLIDDGGPAFPVESYDANTDMDTVKPGMTLRDWFAAHAPEPPRLWWGTGSPDCAGRAQWNYQYADAMLAARKQGGDGRG